ncbi:unnamed protein product [Paramecium sonneborni]|uniref:Uncharacterized protein n=1 Tax=Paramecium sonneborni TaxID=65129 RepID=A0A8S1NMU4_9CILI|nr:unnamed protein product [Paramecium sonneborni]
MIRLTLLFLLITSNLAVTVTINEKCNCEQIKSKQDCVQEICLWKDEKCVKNKEEQNNETVSVYCVSLDLISCQQQKGCAWNVGVCEQFSGCSAYIGSSNDACQQISQQCTSDGTQCIDPLNCGDYNELILCNSNINAQGRRCKWDEDKCRDQKCIEASTTLSTDSECNAFYPGCVTNGKGCVEKRAECSTYGDSCAGKIGSDGNCEKTNNGCTPILCTAALTDLTTNEQCSKFQLGCITTGRGCSKSPLNSCSTYTAEPSICQQMIGLEGKCDSGASNQCQQRKCENASQTNNTDELCQQYLTTCITNGRGCVTQLKLCNTYLGTADECNHYIGSDGKCTLGSNSCKVRVCNEAPDTLKTDADCKDYQNGCVTTGQGCISNRQSCSTYSGTAISCQKYIGKEGHCYGVGDTVAACKAQICSNAPTTYTSHEQCSEFQTGCLTNGKGCVEKTVCISTVKEISCIGTNQCLWNEICVTTTSCQYYNTISLCHNNKADGTVCQWTNGICRQRFCSDAPITYTKDEDCNNFLENCVTNSQGCISKLASCNQYTGTKDTCINFRGNGIKCTSTSVSNAPCSDVLCVSNTTATSQSECDDFMNGCKFQGLNGCIDGSTECNKYYGNQDSCKTQNGVNGTVKCYQDNGVTSSCRNLQCSDNTTATNDIECNLFLNDCVSMGTGCISKSEPCTSYRGNSTADCQGFKGNNKNCWWIGGFSCVDKQCSQDSTSTSDEACKQFLTGCVSKGIGCIEKTELCTTYQGNEDQCQKFNGNEQPCIRKNNCMNRRCSDVISPTSQDQCINYLSTCRFNGSICIDAEISCTSYINLSYTICQQITTQSGGLCYLASGTGTCQVRTCSQKGSANNQSECDKFLIGCVFSGANCVEKQATCDLYINFTSMACRDAKTISNTACYNKSTTNDNCQARTCSALTNDLIQPNSFTAEFCQSYLASCIYNGTACVNKQDSCTLYNPFTVSACKSAFTTSQEKCWQEDVSSVICSVRQCSDTITAPNLINCAAHKASCRYNGTQCVDSQTACNLYTSFTQNACKEITLSDGTTQCWKTTTDVGICESRQCSNILPLYSAIKCAEHISTCKYNGNLCVDQRNDCTLYTGFTSEACKQVTTSSGGSCWIPFSVPQQCTTRLCSNSIENANIQSCLQHLASCRFNGQICVDNQVNCQQYTSFTQNACQNTTTSSGVKCWKSSQSVGSCESRSCSNNVINANYNTCGDHLSTCTFDGVNCYTMQDNCSQYTNVSALQCQNLRTTSGGRCWLALGQGTCIIRQCIHNTIAMTDQECEAFLSGCRTSGKGCVDSTVPCTQYIGTTSSCLTFVGNSIKCKGADSSGSCTVKNCYDNMDGVNDVQCNTFMSGCVSRGKGCIAKIDPCTSYIGNQTTCSQFIGNQKKCWNNSNATSTQQCRDRLCSDDTTSNSDELCQEFQVGCVTKGIGCIDVTSKCTQYTGTQGECKMFKGENGTKQCWNLSTATASTACVNRVCTHNLSATNDQECDTFLKGCITKGQGCVSPQPCSSFQGTIKSCAMFSATDKPCKGISSTTIQSCVSVKCNEAPNNYDTDELCNTFKEGCVTNGFGCVDIVLCEDVQTEKACKSKPTCAYVGNCRDFQTECSALKSQSLCVNTPVSTAIGMCAWEVNNITNVGLCRNWKCEDASENLITHEDCNLLYKNCTTKGKGCISIGSCQSYTTAAICSVAKTTDLGGSCVWNKTYCRQLDCSDASKQLTTDIKCQEFLSNCVTNGKGCINVQYKCEEILIKEKCTIDFKGNTCLWFQSQCITYTKCSDINGISYAQCNKYSKNCTSNGNNCIAIAPCNKYTNPTSCQTGTNGQCGWVAATLNKAAYCTQFTKCSDGTGTTKELCQQFSALCISDGNGCIEITTCSGYVTLISCVSGGTDGICFWDNGTCRQRQCNDATVSTAIEITSHQKCNAFQAAAVCTTDGTNCVQMGLCSTYKEQGCYFGTDGECIYTFPSGQVQGKKSCRLKICTDYNDVTSELCKLRNSQCISNGLYCINKSQCSSYKTKVACNSGGMDGICVFTPSQNDPNNGDCALMTSCQQAKSDMVACKSKFNTCQFLVSSQNGVNSTSCINHTCATIANGSVCKPIYSFDDKQITICVTTASGCAVGDSNQLSASTCFDSTLKTYTWNTATNLCEKCNNLIIQPNNTNNTNSNITNTFTQILFVFPLLIMFQL